MQLLFIMTRLSSAKTLIFTLVIFQRPTAVSVTIPVLQSHKPVCDFKLVLCSYFYLFSFSRLNVSTSHFSVLYVNSRHHIFKHQTEGKNLVLHLGTYGTKNNRNRPTYTQSECTIKELGRKQKHIFQENNV